MKSPMHFVFDLSERSQILRLDTFCGEHNVHLHQVFGLGSWTWQWPPPRKKLWVSYCKPGVQGSLHPRPGVTFQLHISVKMPVLQIACCLKPEFPMSVRRSWQGLASESTWKIAEDTTGASVRLLGDVTPALLNQCQDLCCQ